MSRLCALALLLLLKPLLQPAVAENMNTGVKYRVSNPLPGYEDAEFGFDNADYFEVLSPSIRSRYGEVVWRTLDPVALPDEIIARYENSTIAITGWEVDLVRLDENGASSSVPAFESYNHHYNNFLQGAGAALADGLAGAPNLGHSSRRHEFVATGDSGGAPSVQAFSEHNGNEYRQSYHGLPRGYAQPLAAPRAMLFNPMQINTNDGSGVRGAGPLPAASAAPEGAVYSGLLECPCTTRVVTNASAGTIDGRPYDPRCTANTKRSQLLEQSNPTCAAGTYVGGMECCTDGTVLLDADQEQPPFEDEVFFKWRFYYADFDAAVHTPVVHLEWDVANGCDSGGPSGNPSACAHIEYDVPRAPAGTAPADAAHVLTSSWSVRDMMVAGCDAALDFYCADAAIAAAGGGVKLLMAGGHCHAPACLDIELLNADTGERLCRVAPTMGGGDAPLDEDGYVWLPPCVWADDDVRLPAPPVLGLDTRLTSIKRVNSTSEHFGVMGIWQMRASYAT